MDKVNDSHKFMKLYNKKIGMKIAIPTGRTLLIKYIIFSLLLLKGKPMKYIKPSFKKLSLVLSLLLMATFNSSSFAADASEQAVKPQLHKIQIEVNDNEMATIAISLDGELEQISLPKDALHDPEKLREALKDVPEAMKETLLATLSNLHTESVQLHMEYEYGENSEHHQHSGGEQMVFVTQDQSMADMQKHIVIQTSSGNEVENDKFVFVNNGGLSAEMIIRLIKNAKLSSQDLNEIQQALDVKR